MQKRKGFILLSLKYYGNEWLAVTDVSNEGDNVLADEDIPYFEDMPSNAIIGYVDLVDIKEETDLLWDAGEGQLKWVLDTSPFSQCCQ